MRCGHATFSILALDRVAGHFGVAMASKLPCVGSFCPVVRPGLAAVVTQAWTNPALPYRIFERLAAGDDAEQALAVVMAAEVDAALRQVGVVDAAGRVAGFTGDGVEPAFGHRAADGCLVLGNMLPDATVLEAMDERFAAAAGQPLAERLLLALEAGAERGGDVRGTRSAALKVVAGEVFPLVDLRADDHDRPVTELRRLLGVAGGDLARFIAALPTRANPRGRFETVQDLRPDPPVGPLRR
jgi:uncharacterized Ntn-hydrolase superfamily protein